jgi:hypothetical protein
MRKNLLENEYQALIFPEYPGKIISQREEVSLEE